MNDEELERQIQRARDILYRFKMKRYCRGTWIAQRAVLNLLELQRLRAMKLGLSWLVFFLVIGACTNEGGAGIKGHASTAPTSGFAAPPVTISNNSIWSQDAGIVFYQGCPATEHPVEAAKRLAYADRFLVLQAWGMKQ